MTYANQLREEGRRQNQQEVLKRSRARMLHLLQVKFGTIDIDTIERVQEAEEAKLDIWLERLLTATSIDEVVQG